MNAVLEIANSPLMWAAAACAICVVLWQAYVFFRKSWKTGIEIGMSPKVMKDAMKAAVITSVGPSLSVATGLLVLIGLIGSPMAWERLGFIGALPYELLASNETVNAAGIEMGVDPFGGDIFVTICLVMTLGAFGYTIVATLLADKVSWVQNKLIGNNIKLLGVVSSCALMSSFGSVSTQYMTSISPNLVALIVAAVSMAILSTIGHKKNWLWLKELCLFFAMVIGMVAAAAVAAV